MRKAAPINIIVHYPTTEDGWRELRKRMAEVRANATLNSIQKLKCPTWQKIKLVEAIIEDAKRDIKVSKETKEQDI
jgi:hypothetical protein